MIPGNPGAIQAAASAIDAAVAAAAAAPEGVETARSTARGGWTGQAAEAFDDSAAQTREKLTHFIQTAGRASAPLRTYAGQLQAAQIQFAAAITPAEKAAAVAMAQAANAQAAAAISAIDTDQEQAGLFKDLTKITSIGTGLALGGARAYNLYGSENATKTVTRWQRMPWGRNYLPVTREVADEAARARFATNAARFRYGSWALSPVFAGAGQYFADSANPALTTPQRVGRIGAQAVTVGGASIAASVLAGAALGSVVPVGGTAVGAAVGFVVGAAASIGAGAVMDHFNDGIVDWAGNAAQSVSDTVGGALDKITPW